MKPYFAYLCVLFVLLGSLMLASCAEEESRHTEQTSALQESERLDTTAEESVVDLTEAATAPFVGDTTAPTEESTTGYYDTDYNKPDDEYSKRY